MDSVAHPPPQKKATPRIDLLQKLMARALDPAAGDGEAENAAEKFVRIARIDGLRLDDLPSIFPPALLPPPTPAKDDRPAACDVIMPFGQYRGVSLIDIGQDDLEYLIWLASREMRNATVRRAAKAVLDYLTASRA